MNLNDLFTEEKVRLDPKCWTGKKIGNPKTKMKGGTRVNNCVPAESVNEMDKSQTPPGRDGNNDSDAGKKEYTAKATTPKKVAQDGEKILNKELNKKQGVAEATGDQKFDSMMGQITGGATARQSVDSLNKSLTARTGSDPETALAKWGQEFINWLEKICRNFERQGVDRFNKLEKVGNLDDGGETMAHWLIEVAKQSNTSGITQADIQEFSSEFNTHGMWAWHQFPIAWDLKEWQDYKDQWTGPDGYIANLGQGMTEEYELAGVGVAYELGRRAYKQGMTIRDNPYSATKEARKNDEWAKGLERGKHDANDARHFRSSVREQAVAEGTLDPGVNHRGDVDRNAEIEVLGVDYNTKTWKITYNGKPYTVKADYFSREDLSRWQIPDYDVEIINRNGKNIMNMIDWDNEGSSKTDRQIKMVNTIIAYLDTENAQDIQYMAWKDQELDNVTAHEFYNDIRNFYYKDQQKIDQTVQWLLKNMTDDEAREGLADYIKNPVNPLDWNTKENLKNNRTYLMYVAFSYSREGNTEMTPGMNLPKIQLNDPDDEDELQQQLDALFKKVKFKFDAFENKIVELGDKFGFNPPDLGSGMGAREMFWELTMQTAWPKEYKYTQKAATDILNFKAAVDKYAKSFNSSLIKIGLPGISEYAIWYGVLSDDLTQQQADYFATPEGFANVANGKINVSKMINDNMQRKSLGEKLGDNRPKLGSKRDAGKSIRKWRSARGLDETGVAEGDLDEGWKEKLGGAALAGAMALGAGGANARVMPGDDPSINRLTGKPIATQQATDTAPTQSTSSFSIVKPQAQYDVDTQTLTYKGKQYKWNSDARATGQGEVVTAPSMAVGSRSMGSTKVELNPNGTYTRAPANESQEKVGDMDADKFDAAMARLKQLAGAGPLKTVYDPQKRVYRNVPTAQQPKK